MSFEREHVADEILIDYTDDPASVADRAAIEAHLASCAACSTKTEEYAAFASAMRDEETWWAAGELAGGEGLRALREHSERLAREDAEAARILEPLLESQYRFTYGNIALKRRFQSGGVVRLLSRAAREECDREPRFALLLAETAAAIAEALPDDTYPAGAVNELRGTAWKEYATACRYLGRFDNGLDALHRAERAYRRLIDSGMQLAVVDLSRAIILWDQQHYETALGFARSAARRFSARRETERYMQAKEVEAMILHRQGEVNGAYEIYAEVFEAADSIGDPEVKARAARNLAVASGDRGDTGTASKYLLIALQLYEGLGQRAMIVKTRWSIAWISLLAGNAADAAQRLPAIISDMIALGMSADAARAQLDLAEALLVLERFDEVRDVCTALFSFFRNANMLTGAVTAAAFLREAAARRALTRDDITHVRRYLDALKHSSDLPFAPPPAAP